MVSNSNGDITIRCSKISKKFLHEWIFRELDVNLSSQNNIAVVGPNGSGKSTLLQCISGLIPLTSGVITYQVEKKTLSIDEIYKYISIVSPATELIEEFTLSELFYFHSKFKELQFEDPKLFAEAVFLEKHLHKQVKNFSSGMKQRLKLGLAFFSSTKILLFDEPTTNLDEFGCKWYVENCERLHKNRLIIVASNQKHEYEFCDRHLNIVDFK